MVQPSHECYPMADPPGNTCRLPLAPMHGAPVARDVAPRHTRGLAPARTVAHPMILAGSGSSALVQSMTSLGPLWSGAPETGGVDLAL